MMKFLTQGGGVVKPLVCGVFSLAIFVSVNWTADQAMADPIGTSQLRITVGNTTVTVTDNGVGDDSSEAGAITFDYPIGGFFLVVSTGASKPAMGSASAPYLDLSSIQITGGSAPAVITIA